MQWNEKPSEEQLKEYLKGGTNIFDVKLEDFSHFIQLIKSGVNLGGGRWKDVYTPYMTVAGRVMMARADHAKKGGTLSIETKIIDSKFDKEVVAVCTCTSSLYGVSTGVSSASRDSGKTDGDFPFEISETSAVGRALGFYGYGILPGMSIASAEEVKAAHRKQGAKTPSQPEEPVEEAVVEKAEPSSVTEGQKKAINTLLKRCSIDISDFTTAPFNTTKKELDNLTYTEAGIIISALSKETNKVKDKKGV